MYSSLISFLKLNNIKFYENYSSARLNYFEIGGKINLVAYPDTEAKLCLLLRKVSRKHYKYCLLGNGTNVYISEKYDGIAIITSEIREIGVSNEFVIASAGISISDLAFVTMQNGLSGLEFAFGIPGTVGGAVYMNASAYGDVISSVVYKSIVYDIKRDTYYEIDNASHEFNDKYSIFSKEKNLILLKTVFKLSYADKATISEKMASNLLKRIKSQPLEYGSGGSTFKRPSSNYASKMIDECMLKGASYNGAMVSNQHAGFIINKNEATSNDINKLIEHIQNIVYEKFKIRLEKEIILVE